MLSKVDTFQVNFILVYNSPLQFLAYDALKFKFYVLVINHANNAIHDCMTCNVCTPPANDMFISARPMNNVRSQRMHLESCVFQIGTNRCILIVCLCKSILQYEKEKHWKWNKKHLAPKNVKWLRNNANFLIMFFTNIYSSLIFLE